MRGPLSLAAVALTVAAGAAAEPAGTITVTGSATVYVKPDMARIHYSVRVTEPAADAAKHAASKRVAAVGDAIDELKLGSVTTSAGALSYGRATSAAARRVPAGFGGAAGGALPGGGAGGPPVAPAGSFQAQVPLTTTVREKDPARLRAAVDNLVKTIVESGATTAAEVGDTDSPFLASRVSTADGPRVEWLLEDDAAARRTVLRAAAEKAKANAATLSRELGWESLKVVSLVDGPSAPRDPAEVAVPAPRAPAGEVAVSARVTLTCSR